MDPDINWRTKRWSEQRWLLDSVIRTVGIEWDQPRLFYTTEPVGIDMIFEANSIREKVKAFADITREFLRVAKGREERAIETEKEEHFITAGENYLAASLMYGAALWPIWEDDDPLLIELNEKKNRCYDKFIEHAPHYIERVEIPFEGKGLSALLHLPTKEREGKYPCVISIPGMDSFKECLVRMHGDKLLTRGIAVLAVDGPGQGESPVRKIKVTVDNYDRAGKAMMDFVQRRKEVDGNRVGMEGVSLGSYWAPRVIAHDGRFKAGAVTAVCHEPGMRTLFNSLSTPFKPRFMWIAGIYNEENFDRFASKMSLERMAAKIRCPFLITAGEDDQISPIKYTYDFYKELAGPKMLIVYEGQRHRILDPHEPNLRADWIKDRLDGTPFESCIIKVDMNGKAQRKE